MSKLKVYSSALAELYTIDGVISCSRTETINSDNTLSFSMFLNSENKDWINDTNIIGLDGDYFDISKYKKGHNQDGKLTVSAECEHVSYRLNDSSYDVEYYTGMASPASILAELLAGTGFTAGTVEFSGIVAYSIQEKMSRRAMLVQFAGLLGGELLFNGFTVSILQQRGSSTPKDLREGRNISVISKEVDKTRRDELGNPIVAYECELVAPTELSLGDVVTMSYDTLGIDISLRIVSITTNPYNAAELSFDVSNTVPAIEDEAYEIAASTVAKDKIYNGCRIGPTYGFEAVRSDKKARAYFRSDGMRFQAGDGSGTSWTDKLYYDYDGETGNTELFFAGKLTAEVIEALSALITPNLYAGKATISELTVDRLDTSDKVRKYLNHDASDDNFQRIYDQYHELVTASTDGLEANKVQAVNRDGDPLYWTDETYTAATTEETDYPVYTYSYTEQVKWKVFFYEHSTGLYVPAMKWGAGAPENENLDSCLMYKLEGEFRIVMTNADGTQVKLKMSGQNAVLEGNTGSFGVRNIGIGTSLPTTGQDGDLYILTGEA